MVPSSSVGDKIFQWLVEIDEETSRRVAQGGCRWCGGRLHRGDYLRKPRGGLLAQAGEAFCRRFSLCCGRRGCRRRAMPPSVRFLGRRVYLGVAVVLASILALTATSAREMERQTGIPGRTVRRWHAYWESDFPRSRLFQEQRGRFLPPLCVERLPASLLERFERQDRDGEEVLLRTLCFLAPLTTQSVPDGSRFVRAG
jgi:hypothetical protein